MLIAKCSVRGFHPPQRLHKCAKNAIDIDTGDLPAGAVAWTTCVQALPHIDPSWPEKLILTLTVKGDDYLTDDAAYLQQGHESVRVPPGSPFVVDPLSPHWLIDEDAASGHEKPSCWIGLQWEVTRREASHKCLEIVTRLRGRWLKVQDERYRTWAPA